VKNPRLVSTYRSTSFQSTMLSHRVADFGFPMLLHGTNTYDTIMGTKQLDLYRRRQIEMSVSRVHLSRWVQAGKGDGTSASSA
jgi:hypothetical protein